MSDRCDNGCCNIKELAQWFWPVFKDLCKRHKLLVFVCGVWYGYVGWRDKKSNNPFLWAVKSFLKGFDCKFLSCMILCLLVSEIPFVVTLVNGKWDFSSVALIVPLFSALPALMGMVLLDYLLEPDLSRTILFPAILAMIFMALFGYYYGAVKPSLAGIYVVTMCVFFMSWCIKVGDQRMIEKNDDAQSVLPNVANATPDISHQDVVQRGSKTITINRPKG